MLCESVVNLMVGEARTESIKGTEKGSVNWQQRGNFPLCCGRR